MDRVKVGKKLWDMGFDKSRGRDYILDMLEILESKPDAKLMDVYSMVGRINNRDPNTIGNSISKAISGAWENGLSEYFLGKPKPKTFLAIMLKVILLKTIDNPVK